MSDPEVFLGRIPVRIVAVALAWSPAVRARGAVAVGEAADHLDVPAEFGERFERGSELVVAAGAAALPAVHVHAVGNVDERHPRG